VIVFVLNFYFIYRGISKGIETVCTIAMPLLILIAFVILVWLIGRWGASRASYSAVLIPIVTTVAAVLLSGERVTLSLALGGAIVLVGVWIGALAGDNSGKAPADEDPS
ncbi:MAG: hypothetical protein ACLGIK_05695, partial [Gemmatimonadota bacterium]